jgi:hypothetical protein
VENAAFVNLFLGDSLIEAVEKIIPIELGRPNNERPALVDDIEVGGDSGFALSVNEIDVGVGEEFAFDFSFVEGEFDCWQRHYFFLGADFWQFRHNCFPYTLLEYWASMSLIVAPAGHPPFVAPKGFLFRFLV